MCMLERKKERKKETLEKKEREYSEYTYSQRSWSSSSKRCCPPLTFAIHWSKSITPDDDAGADFPLLFSLSSANNSINPLRISPKQEEGESSGSSNYFNKKKGKKKSYRGGGVVSSEYKLNRSISSPAPNTISDIFSISFFKIYLF